MQIFAVLVWLPANVRFHYTDRVMLSSRGMLPGSLVRLGCSWLEILSAISQLSFQNNIHAFTVRLFQVTAVLFGLNFDMCDVHFLFTSHMFWLNQIGNISTWKNTQDVLIWPIRALTCGFLWSDIFSVFFCGFWEVYYEKWGQEIFSTASG